MINDTRFTTPYPQFSSDPEVLQLFAPAKILICLIFYVSGMVDFAPSATSPHSRQPVRRRSQQVSQSSIQYAVDI
jgi:hypothetical protein